MERVSTFGEEHWVVRFSGQTARLGGVLNTEAAPSTNCALVRTTRRALTAGLRLRSDHGFVFRREQATPSSAALPVRTGGVLSVGAGVKWAILQWARSNCSRIDSICRC